MVRLPCISIVSPSISPVLRFALNLSSRGHINLWVLEGTRSYIPQRSISEFPLLPAAQPRGIWFIMTISPTKKRTAQTRKKTSIWQFRFLVLSIAVRRRSSLVVQKVTDVSRIYYELVDCTSAHSENNIRCFEITSPINT